MSEKESVDPAALPIRDDLAQARTQAWARLAAPGTWWSGADRLAIAAEARAALACALCAARKQALSPFAVTGDHDGLGVLSGEMVDVVHRIRTDAGRLTRAWVESVIAAGVGEGEYVEAIGVVATITALDTFDLGLGLPLRSLPQAVDGAPSRHRPAGAKRDLAWVATLAPEDLSADDVDPFSVHGALNIHRALSLVPQEVMNFFDLDIRLYLPDDQIRDFANEHRALTHPQIELMAGRTSALNGCFY